MADKQILLRKQDGSGSGMTFKTQAEADAFLEANPGYAVESAEETAANQAAADEATGAATETDAPTKAVNPAEDKAVSSPKKPT
jgi:hypothetical protein